MGDMLIKVTKEHIRNGRMGSRGGCPVSLAMHDKGYYNTDIDTKSIRYNDNGTIRHARTPEIVKDFIRRFDHYLWRRPVQSFEFMLEPYETTKAGDGK